MYPMARQGKRPIRHRLQVAPGWDSVLLENDELPLAQWQREGRVAVVKDSPHRLVFRVQLPQAAIYVKRYRRRSLWDRLRQRWAITPARREWLNLRKLAELGIPTVEPLAWIEERLGPWTFDSLLITRAAQGAVPLEQYMDEHLAQLAPEKQNEQMRTLAVHLGRLVAALHRAGALEPDLHLGNVLVVPHKASVDNSATLPRLPDPTPEGDRVTGQQPASHSAEKDHSARNRHEQQAGSQPVGQSSFHDTFAHLRLVLVDVRKLRLSGNGPLPWHQARRNLVALHAATFDRVSLRVRMQFWRTYAASTGGIVPRNRRKTLSRLWYNTLSYARRLAMRHDRRLHRQDGRIIREGNHGVVLVFYGPPFQEQCETRTRQMVIRLLAEHPCTAASGRQAIGEQSCPSNGSVIGPLRWTCASLVPSTAESRRLLERFHRQWLSGMVLRHRRIPGPQPVLLAVSRNCGQQESSQWHAVHLAAMFPGGGSPLDRFLQGAMQYDDAGRWALTALGAVALGQLVGRLHLWAVFSDHWNLERFLIDASPGNDGARPTVRVCVGSFERLRAAGAMSQGDKIEQLAPLAEAASRHPAVTRTMCLRFLRSYLRTTQEGSFRWKTWWRAVARSMQR